MYLNLKEVIEKTCFKQGRIIVAEDETVLLYFDGNRFLELMLEKEKKLMLGDQKYCV